MLVLILLTIQHLLNWLWRKALKDESLIPILFGAIIMAGGVTFGLIKLILIWGAQFNR